MSTTSAGCRFCKTDEHAVGTLPREEDGVRVLCSLCLLREDVELYDRNFGGGVPGLIAQECYALRDMLHEKQRAYGNSALDPIRIFSKADPEEGLRVRLDDKLSRLARGSAAGEDTIQDLLGYLILLRVARRLRPETP